MDNWQIIGLGVALIAIACTSSSNLVLPAAFMGGSLIAKGVMNYLGIGNE